jgi:ubiquinone/menaquinone biosynthesis C-methylase UbiE
MDQPYARSAEIYDLLYAQRIDYAVNAERIRRIVEQRSPSAQTLLEAACGTGAYLERFAERFDVTGIDSSPQMLDRARARLPGRRLVEADMSDFDLGETFDVVVCLFSSVAYLQTLEALRATFRCFARHLSPGGVVIVEPWFSPDQWFEGQVHATTAQSEALAVARVSTSHRDGRRVTMNWAFAVAHSDGRAETFVEAHVTGQFTVEEHLAAFRAAGLDATHDAEGLMGRGLYVAARP